MRELDEEIEKTMARWHLVSPRLFADLEKVAGYQAPKSLLDSFSSLQSMLFDEHTSSLNHLRHPRPGGPDWLQRYRSGMLDNVQEGIYACCYHLSRIEDIESAMLQIAKSYLSALGPTPTGSCVAGGNSRALNFEYQALAFSLRRTLEYVGVAVGAYFKSDCHSIRQLSKIVHGREPTDQANLVVECLSKQLPGLEDILPSDKQVHRSLRDRLAHWEAVKAGCFNISSSPRGFMVGLVGGGHDLDFCFSSDQSVQADDQVLMSVLGPKLKDQFERVMSLVWMLVDATARHKAAQPIIPPDLAQNAAQGL